MPIKNPRTKEQLEDAAYWSVMETASQTGLSSVWIYQLISESRLIPDCTKPIRLNQDHIKHQMKLDFPVIEEAQSAA